MSPRTPSGPDRPTLALLDYETVPTSPVGNVHRQVISSLCEEFDITVFSVRFDNPRSERIRWVRIPAVRRPLILLFVTFHAMVLLRWAWERLRGCHFDVVHSIESASVLGDVVHAQFCHRWFLDHAWAGSRPSGYRGFARYLFEVAAAALEPLAFWRAKLIVVPSRGMGVALTHSFPAVASKLRVVHNSIDLARMRPPDDFDRRDHRAQLELDDTATLLVFVALGHFERKGLPLVLDALETTGSNLQLLVVGGTAQALAPYRRRVEDGPLQDRVRFTGHVEDVRPHLWASDAFILPSSFEGFPLVALEAGAAGLPVIATRVNGIEEILVDGDAGFVIERDASSIAAAIKRLDALDHDAQARMARRATEAVAMFSPESMVEKWRQVYQSVVRRSRRAGDHIHGHEVDGGRAANPKAPQSVQPPTRVDPG